MKNILFIVTILAVQMLYPDTLSQKQAKLLTDTHLQNLTIDFGVIDCLQDAKRKYIVIDYIGTIYAVNGAAKGYAKKAGWKDAKSLLKKGGDPLIFTQIIDTALKNGCRKYYHYGK